MIALPSGPLRGLPSETVVQSSCFLCIDKDLWTYQSNFPTLRQIHYEFVAALRAAHTPGFFLRILRKQRMIENKSCIHGSKMQRKEIITGFIARQA
jgi:hypothetical protein